MVNLFTHAVGTESMALKTIHINIIIGVIFKLYKLITLRIVFLTRIPLGLCVRKRFITMFSATIATEPKNGARNYFLNQGSLAKPVLTT